MKQHFKIIEMVLARFDRKPTSREESNFCKNYLTINREQSVHDRSISGASLK